MTGLAALLVVIPAEPSRDGLPGHARRGSLRITAEVEQLKRFWGAIDAAPDHRRFRVRFQHGPELADLSGFAPEAKRRNSRYGEGDRACARDPLGSGREQAQIVRGCRNPDSE